MPALKENDLKYVRLRGLPFSAKDNTVREFLSGCTVLNVNLPLNAEGRASGDAYVGLKTTEDVEKALKKHKETIDRRYIEVFHMTYEEYVSSLRRGFIDEENRLIKLRGMPFSATDKDIYEFLKDLDCEEIIVVKSSSSNRPSGEAVVRLGTPKQVEVALQRNKQHMGSRYVEVFPASIEEAYVARGWPLPGGGPHNGNGPMPLRDIPPFAVPPVAVPAILRDIPEDEYWGDERRGMRGRGGGGYGDRDESWTDGGYARGGPMRGAGRDAVGGGYGSRPAPYDVPRPLGGGGGGADEWSSPTKVLMRGLPFEVTPMHIEQFFAPLRCYDIKLGFTEDRQPSGDGSVEFGTISEAREALSRNRNVIGKRYIELFPSYDIPPAVRRVRFRTVGGAPAPSPAPLSAPSRTGGGGPPGYGGGGGYEREPAGYPPHRAAQPTYDDDVNGYYSRGQPQAAPPARGPPRGYDAPRPEYGARGRDAVAPPPQGRGGPEGGRGGAGGGYASFPSQEYSGAGRQPLAPQRYPQQGGGRGDYDGAPRGGGMGMGGGGQGYQGGKPDYDGYGGGYGAPQQRGYDDYGGPPAAAQPRRGPYGAEPQRAPPARRGPGDFGYERTGGKSWMY